MTNSSRILLISISLLALGAAGPGLLLAKGPPPAGEIVVDSATPDFAVQGESNKAIALAGSNFPKYAKVKFPIDDPACDLLDSAVTVVQDVVARTSANELKFNIDVPEIADLGDYDICVYETDRFGTLSGRKGKGTTKLFSVKEKPNQSSDVFTPVEIEAEYYERVDSDPLIDEELEEAERYEGPYEGGSHHPWTGTVSYIGRTFSWDYDNWTANTLAGTPRRCLVGANLNDPPTAGRYDCFDGGGENVVWPYHGGRILIPLAGMVWENVTVAKNGRSQEEPGFCTLLNEMGAADGVLEFGATRYTLFFMEGCDVSVSCPITINTLSYSGASPQQGGGQIVLLHPFHDLDGLPDIGRMVLTGFVTSMPVPAADGELNVFTVPQDLMIGKFRIELRNNKNAGLEAICETVAPDETTEAVENIRFKTAPAPSP
jgi:hypothetical protein